MSAAAARFVAARIRAKPDAVLLLPTGTTPLGMYGRLVELHAEEGLSFARATFFNLDEYLGLAPDHPASYHVYMEENFYKLVDANPARVHVPDGSAPDPEAECERYEAAIREAGGVDLCVLGIGRNGHIGFNEPGAPFGSRTRVVQPAASTPETSRGTGLQSGRSPSAWRPSSRRERSCCSPRARTRQGPWPQQLRARSPSPCPPRCSGGTRTPRSSSTGRQP
jgi:glucosamine-6-phosphate deaminase